jgi:capsular exopolysaccharide synthesis family protein
MIESYLRNSRNNFSTTPSTLGIQDLTLNNLIAAYNVAQLERKALLDRQTPRGNPLVQSKEDEIEKLRQNILENLRNIRTTYGNTISELRRRNGQAQSQIRLLPEKQQRLLEIERQQATKQAVYNILLEQKERSSITLAATTSNINVLESAGVNSVPIAPNRRNVQALAVFIGLLLPALFIFVLELLNDKVTTRGDIERITDISILGEVGHSYAKEALIVKPNNRGIVAEQFRIIRSNLQYVLHAIPKPVILVTSSFSGEGKSFISTNIGAVMALTGKRTIILEFDIRKPKVLSHLNLAKQPGLTNYLLGKITLEQLPIPVPGHENLFVLACGPIPPNPAELLLDVKFEALFAYLKTNFDVVVMDTAPVGMVSDALSLSKFADATLYIARQGHTYKKQVGLIDDFYRQGKLPKVSLVLNDVKLTAGYGGYGYGYGYGYGSGYFDDEESPAPTLLTKWFGWMDLSKWKKKKAKKRA